MARVKKAKIVGPPGLLKKKRAKAWERFRAEAVKLKRVQENMDDPLSADLDDLFLSDLALALEDLEYHARRAKEFVDETIDWSERLEKAEEARR